MTYDEPIRDLLPRTRAGGQLLRILWCAGIRTLGDLLHVTSAGLLAIPQFGPARLEIVRELLASRGLVLADELEHAG
jgi:DNA-directed RNA polymerase alpha subunit